jgi:hypothetical protein
VGQGKAIKETRGVICSKLAVGNSRMNTGDEVAFSEQNSLKKP